MNFKTRNLKMKMFIVFLILFLSAMLVYRTKMADRDYANVLLENTKARLVSESGINVLVAKINSSFEEQVSLNSVFNKILEDGWLQAGTEKNARFRITYIRPQEGQPSNKPMLFNTICEGKCGAYTYITTAVLEIKDNLCSVKSIKTTVDK